ncbi:MAG TPA: Na+/H+ antiporter NhaC [Cytophagales bacterium]|jgi:NhaC family Na+:H+ antiporter|nr:Na+/H+ antiporter NhaC [Cytophagales bacterium]
MSDSTTTRRPTLFQSLLPILFLIALLASNVYIFGDEALDGSNQIVLILSAAVACLVAMRFGMKWGSMLKGMVNSIHSAMPSILILLLIGSLAGTWLLSGIVPAMIYYGLQVLTPTYILVASCIVCAMVSLATGSSWTTIATVGVALVGIGKALGISEGIIGGAIISGAYFGDKMSPLSDTTNLAPAMAGTDLFTHIRYMALTTIPSLTITLIIFLFIGFGFNTSGPETDISPILNAIDKKFYITPWLFLVPVLVIVLIIKKIPAIPSLLSGTLLGAVFAIFLQPEVIFEISGIGNNVWKSNYVAVMQSMYGDISIVTDHEIVDELLSTGGMFGMLKTVWLIMSAMVFGGVMEQSGMLRRITEEIIKVAHNTGSLVAATATTCIFFNLTASDQYLSIVVPGRMFRSTYQDRNLAPQNLSRTLEDSGTVTSVLIPWNTCGATQSSVLGVSTLAYAPFTFFSIISPIMTVIFAVAGIKIAKLTRTDHEKSNK